MSDTPETDDLARGNHVVPTEWAQQLERHRNDFMYQLEQVERERDDLLKELNQLKEKYGR